MDDLALCDLGYVTGSYHYDDEQEEERLQVRKNIKRALVHMQKFAMEGISEPIYSYTNLDY